MDDAIFPDLSNYFDECKVIINNINDGQNYQNKTQVVINPNFSLTAPTVVCMRAMDGSASALTRNMSYL